MMISWIQSVTNGDKRAFLALYQHTNRGVYYKVLRVLCNQSDAEDVLQETYSKVWSQSLKFESSKGCVKGWINAIAFNLSLDLLRLKNRNPVSFVETVAALHHNGEETICPSPQPLELTISGERAGAVRNCLKFLSPAQRECLNLAFFEDLSHAQIASRLGMPLGTVKTSISRAYLCLRPKLSRHH
jgi:RNA polymerase sigma-70 factor, ECF subfamily